MVTPVADAEHMRRALALAERGRGLTSPNPLVGSVVVSDSGVIVGAGYHARAGGPHAEIVALSAAGSRARGATLYCTLEPCCHTGRTGPCTLAIEEAGVRRVVAAMGDPSPLVAGGGFGHLRAHGVVVEEGVLAAEARRQNEVFLTNVRRGRPFVTMKIATSLDGRIAAGPGRRTAITSAAANLHAQRFRAEVDAIGIGSGTMLADDPLLTVRDVYRLRPLTRVVFDTRLRTSPQARLLGTLDRGPVLIVTSADASRSERARALEAAGARLLALEERSLAAACRALLARGVTSLLLEGGAELHASAWRENLLDRVRVYVAPRALGDQGVPWNLPPSFSMAALADRRALMLGDDALLEGDVHGTH
jgi:diaminohydroxyphosphoribosylaminopyrimidine deaminase/5-amino-6-(5-phosphoribosylamino)uracil reductase